MVGGPRSGPPDDVSEMGGRVNCIAAATPGGFRPRTTCAMAYVTTLAHRIRNGPSHSNSSPDVVPPVCEEPSAASSPEGAPGPSPSPSPSTSRPPGARPSVPASPSPSSPARLSGLLALTAPEWAGKLCSGARPHGGRARRCGRAGDLHHSTATTLGNVKCSTG